LTDPDAAGERIRRFLGKRFPNAKHAFIPKEDAIANDDIGVEQASPTAIRRALEKVRTLGWQPSNEFDNVDMVGARLNGFPDSADRRAAIGASLGIGYANAKTFLKRLNNYGVTREEFMQALDEADKASKGK
jgi:ribonuclease M5